MDFFIGRANEVKLLKETISLNKSTISILYGRRRIGKSALIKEVFREEKVYFFEGLENQDHAGQIENFMAQLAYQTKKPLFSPPPKVWREAFLALLDLVKDQSVVLVFDEFQWMANYRSEIVSHLKMVWEQYLSKAGKVSLILCGSIASFMIKKVLNSKALFGRSDLVIHLQPFKLDETKKMLSPRADEEVLEAHILMGGIPKYLELLNKEPSIYQGIQKLAFRPHGYFLDEYKRIFVSHFGKNNDYKKIVETLAEHPYGLSRQQLCEAAKVEAGGWLTEQLFDLETAGFIQSYKPFDKSDESKHIIYCLKDPYFRFYFAFIKPYLKKIKGQTPDLFYRLTQKQIYSSWLGRSFEYTCQDHANKIAQILGFSGIDYVFGPYFEPGSKTKKGIQIDLVFDRADKVITLCEIKYTEIPPGVELIEATEKKVNLIRAKTKKTIQKVLITKTMPSTQLVNRGYFYKIILAKNLIESLV